MVCISFKNKVYTKYVHRLVGESFINNPLIKKEINHIDGNKMNNNVDNLEWVTPKENVAHAIRTGLINNTGIKHYACKISDEDVKIIKSSVLSLKELSKTYKVSEPHISLIRNNKRRSKTNRTNL